jgi:hypothetical protein
LKGSDAGLVLCSCTLLRSFTRQPAFLPRKRLKLLDVLAELWAISALGDTVALGLQADLLPKLVFRRKPLSSLPADSRLLFP